MTESLVEYDCRDHIATLTLNPPEQLDALSDKVVWRLSAKQRCRPHP